MKMDRYSTKPFPCTVCGQETEDHAEWFLVAENRWLDRVKILHWHPALAAQAQMQSVCGEHHLKMLITHWLTHANLQILATGISRFAIVSDPKESEPESRSSSAGRLVGELAVYRESLSRLWTGSPEALESILTALIGAPGSKETFAVAATRPDADPQKADSRPLFETAGKYFRGYAFQ